MKYIISLLGQIIIISACFITSIGGNEWFFWLVLCYYSLAALYIAYSIGKEVGEDE